MKVTASPRSRAQVAAVLAFVISSATSLAAQDDKTGGDARKWYVSHKSLGAPNP